MRPIYVTKSFLPDFEEYKEYLDQIWENRLLTNRGPLCQRLEEQLKEYLGEEKLLFVTNGTIAIQLALNALGIEEGEIITTPFTYVATTSAILWERCTPVYADICEDTLCLDPQKVEKAINERTRAIVAVHVYGYPCDVEGLAEIAQKHRIPLIFDAAHAMGAKYKGKSLCTYGDASTLSFHATKLFHTIEGGALLLKDRACFDKAELTMRFGHTGDEHFMLGINAKASEFNAAMGLANLPYLERLIAKRKEISECYDSIVIDKVKRPYCPDDLEYNYAYYPVILQDEEQTLRVIKNMQENGIYPRRYFYPSLNKLPYLKEQYSCPISEDMSKRIICLPLYPDLALEDAERIANILRQTV